MNNWLGRLNVAATISKRFFIKNMTFALLRVYYVSLIGMLVNLCYLHVFNLKNLNFSFIFSNNQIRKSNLLYS